LALQPEALDRYVLALDAVLDDMRAASRPIMHVEATWLAFERVDP
jgi:hypothetical protein